MGAFWGEFEIAPFSLFSLAALFSATAPDPDLDYLSVLGAIVAAALDSSLSVVCCCEGLSVFVVEFYYCCFCYVLVLAAVAGLEASCCDSAVAEAIGIL